MKLFNCTDGSKLNFRIVGSGVPILFIHGWNVDLHLWLNKIEAIPGKWKRQYQRIYFDLPGMGKSTASKTVVNSDDVLKCVEEFLDFVVPVSNYLLAGESYGGYLARGLLAHQKERILGLFMLCPLVYPGWRKGRVASKEVLQKDNNFLITLTEKERNEFDYLSVVQIKKMWLDYKKDIRLDIIPENIGFLDSQLQGSFTDKVNTVDIQYDKPTLIMLGRQDTEVGFEDQYELYKNYQRATIQVIDFAGHNLQIERFKLFFTSFMDWIERVEISVMTDIRQR